MDTKKQDTIIVERSISPRSKASNVPEFASTFREILFLFVICSSQHLAQACLAQALVPAREIAADFSTSSSSQISWFTAAYSLTFGTFILLAGFVGDRYGHRRCFVAGYLWLSLWSLVAGLSSLAGSIVLFDFCRAQQGLGAAILLPNALAILGRVYAPGSARKNMAFAIFGAAAPSGFVMGALFSAILSQFASWPWAFYVTAMVAFCLGLSAKAVIPHVPPAHNDAAAPTGDGGRSYLFEIASQASFGIAGLILFNVAWNQAHVVGWAEPYIIVLLILGSVSIGTFIWVTGRSTYRLIPADIVKTETAFVLAIIGLGWASFGIVVLYYVEFLEVVRHASPLSAAAQTLPGLVSGPLAAVVTGLLMATVPHAFLLFPALLAFCTANIISVNLPVDQSFWLQAFWVMAIAPFGTDISFPTATVLLSNTVSEEHQGIAASLVTTTVNYSISIGLGIAGTVVSSRGTSSALEDYRIAWYVGVGLSGCGTLLALYFAADTVRKRRKGQTG